MCCRPRYISTNSRQKIRPAPMPAHSVRSRSNRGTPRARAQASTRTTAKADRNPTCSTGDMPPLATLIATWLTPQTAQQATTTSTARPSSRSAAGDEEEATLSAIAIAFPNHRQDQQQPLSLRGRGREAMTYGPVRWAITRRDLRGATVSHSAELVRGNSFVREQGRPPHPAFGHFLPKGETGLAVYRHAAFRRRRCRLMPCPRPSAGPRPTAPAW